MTTDVPMTLIHAEPLHNDAGRERLVVLADERTIVVAQRAFGEERAQAEGSFAIDEAAKLAAACLAGNERALSRPGLTRILASAVILLSKAAYLAGALEEAEGPGDGGAG